jgi:hypothetical protein
LVSVQTIDLFDGTLSNSKANICESGIGQGFTLMSERPREGWLRKLGDEPKRFANLPPWIPMSPWRIEVSNMMVESFLFESDLPLGGKLIQRLFCNPMKKVVLKCDLKLTTIVHAKRVVGEETSHEDGLRVVNLVISWPWAADLIVTGILTGLVRHSMSR